MTEDQWLACEDPARMLTFLGRQAADRKLLLFICHCCRQVLWDHLDEPGRQAVEAGERYAHGGATKAELTAAYRALKEHRDGVSFNIQDELAWSVFWAVDDNLSREGAEPYDAVAFEAVDLFGVADREAIDRMLAPALRDLIGSPFRPVSADAAWRTPAVVQLAADAYDARALPAGHLDPVRLAVLADALEEAGCSDADLLGHLRGPGPHVRGCWALDLILGKE